MESAVKWVVAVIAGIFILCLGMCSTYQVDSTERGVILSWGKVNGLVDPGLHLKVPFRDECVKVNTQTLKAEAPAVAASKNMQSVHTTVSVNYHLDPSKVDSIYVRTGLDVETKIIDSRIQEVVKAVVAKYTADELLAQREGVKAEITELLTAQVLPYNIIVEAGGVQITNFEFSAAFVQAIENKQIAEQNALKAKNDLDRIKVEAEQAVASAKGTAEAIRIQAEAIRSQGGAEYVQLKAIEKWNGQLPTYSGGNGPMPFLSIK
jgi:regulator of protease activity HflC (stomatin/prohibitin superfamily)